MFLIGNVVIGVNAHQVVAPSQDHVLTVVEIPKQKSNLVNQINVLFLLTAIVGVNLIPVIRQNAQENGIV